MGTGCLLTVNKVIELIVNTRIKAVHVDDGIADEVSEGSDEDL